MEVLSGNELIIPSMGLVEEIKKSSVVFHAQGKRIEIQMDQELIEEIKDILSEDEFALFPIDATNDKLLLDAVVV